MKHLNLDQYELLDKYVIYSATDLDGIITEASSAFCKISGYSKEELIGKPHSIVRHLDMDGKVFEKMWKDIKSGKTWEGDIFNQTKKGEGYWVHARIEPIYNKKGKIEGYFAVREDISKHKLLNQANQSLAEQVKLTRAILDNSKTAIATADKKGFFIDANKYFKKKLLCLDNCESEVTLIDLVANEGDKESLQKQVKEALSKKGHCNFKRLDIVRQCQNAKEKVIPAEVYMSLLPDRKTVVVVLNFIKDKLKLKNSLKKSRIYFQKASVGFFITDLDDKILKSNPKFRSMIGIKKKELKDAHISSLFINNEKYQLFRKRVEATFATKKDLNFVFSLKKNDNEEFWAEISGSKFSKEEVIENEAIFWTVRDITSKIESKKMIEKQNEELIYLNENLKKEVKKQVEENLRKDKLHQEEQLKNAKFTAIGQLAAGITHEINTPLTYIKGNFEMIELDIDSISEEELKNEIKKQLVPIKEGLERIATIVENMREISQKTKEQKSVINIYSTLITAITLLSNRAKHIAPIYLNGEKFAIGMDKDAQNYPCYAQLQRLEQVWVILLNNALDELEKVEPFEKRKITVEIDQDDLNLYVRFKDNGGGIDEKIVKNIFEPFVTDKSSKGMGIGLNVAQQIIAQQDGSIKVKNSKGGAEFEVRLKKYKV